MISVFRKNNKSIFKIVSDVFQSMIDDIQTDLSEAICGYCKGKGSLEYFCIYVRSITFIENDFPVTKRLTLRRYICVTCGKTHVVVPGTQIIPYGRYSLGFILHVLCEYIKRDLTVRQIAEKYQISISTLYAWKHRFKKHCVLLEGKLNALEEGYDESVEDICNDKQVGMRLHTFIETYKFAFMQIRRKEKRSYIFVLTGYFISCSRGSP